MITMQLMTRTVEVICIIGCLQCVIPLVRALPPEGEILLDTEIPPLSGDLLGENLPGLPPATVDVTNNAFKLTADSTNVIYKDSITNSQAESLPGNINNAIKFQASSAIGNSGTAGEEPLSFRSFNTPDTQVGSDSNSVSSVSTQGGGGAGLLASSNLNNNVNPSTLTSTGQIGTNGFLATVAGRPSSPPRIGRVMFSQARAGSKMRLPNNRLRLTSKPFIATLANQPKRTFNAIQRSSGMMTPFTVPVSAQPLTFQPMNFEPQPSMSYLPTSNFAARLRTERRPTFLFRSPEMFQTSFYSPSDQTFPTAPFVGSGSDFSSAPFSSTSVNLPTVPSFPPAMPFQNPLDILPVQTFTSIEPPRVTMSSVPPNIAVPPVPHFSQTFGSPFLPYSTFAGPSVQSNTFSSEPETSVTVLPPITINDIPSFSSPTIEIQSPPPPAQIRQSSMMTGQTPITVTPLAPFRLNAAPLPDRTSIPISFQTTQAFPTPNFAPFTVPMHSEGTNMFRLNRVLPIQARGGNIGTPMVGAGAGAGTVGAAAAAVRAQGVTNTGGVFSAGIPLVDPILPMWSQFNDIGRPILSNIQAF